MFVSHSGNYLILQMTAPGKGENFKEIKQTRKHRREERGETAESEEMFLKWKSSRLAAVKILEYKIIRGIVRIVCNSWVLQSSISRYVRTIFICPTGDNKTIKV